jgi:MFS family permease
MTAPASTTPASAAHDFTRQERTAGIAVAITCATLVGVGLSLSIPLLAFAMEAKGASGATIGINTAMGGVATVLVAPLTPRVARALGVRATLAGALALGAAAIAGFAAADPLWAWFPLRLLFGAALAVLFVLSEFWINAFAPPRSRGLVMGVYATALSLGFGAGPLILTVTGMSGLAPYLACAALFAAAGAPLLLAGCATPELERAAPGRGVTFFFRVAPVATFAGFTFGAVETGAFTFLPLYGAHVGLTAATAALLVSVIALGNVASQIPLGLLSDRMDRRKLLLALGLIGTAGAAAIPAASGSPATLFALVGVWGGLLGGLYTVALAHLGARFSGVDLATANAAFIIMYSLGLMAGPPILGLGFDLWPPYGVPAAIATLIGGFALVAALRVRRSA